jgi:hypothetical protein
MGNVISLVGTFLGELAQRLLFKVQWQSLERRALITAANAASERSVLQF